VQAAAANEARPEAETNTTVLPSNLASGYDEFMVG
jgi:hypothetical protein